ncbi:MAG: DUF3880 domain-containing protein [Bilophila sp.]
MRIRDELGRLRTLDSNAFLTVTGAPLPKSPLATGENQTAGDRESLLLLGLGPEPARLTTFIEAWRSRAAGAVGSVYWIECPDFEAQMPQDWKNHIPAHWTRLHVSDRDTPDLLTRIKNIPPAHIWRYEPGAQLFSAFWGPLLGAVQAKLIGCAPLQASSRTVLLPGARGDLLTLELEQGVAQSGFTPLRLPHATAKGTEASPLLQMLRDERPALFLSVNLRGLDAEGNLFRLLQACGVPVALWFVDNPWHILSSLRTPWWREAALFVTDASFLAPLRAHGAAFVRHLPLGTWMHPAVPRAQSAPLHPLVFVGRASFPAHDRFFSGCHLSEALLKEGCAQLHTSTPPHAHWWEQRLGIESCWPGTAIRQAGYGAECCATARRRDWLLAANPLGLTVFGDDAWKKTLPMGCDVRPALDYYNALPAVYSEARYSLNVTSLLLPEGLTQRHFDVWAAGGFLFSDPTPGLSLFPPELVEPITVTSPRELASRMRYIERDSLLRYHLIKEWQAYLNREHTYKTRFETLLHEISAESAYSYAFQAS